MATRNTPRAPHGDSAMLRRIVLVPPASVEVVEIQLDTGRLAFALDISGTFQQSLQGCVVHVSREGLENLSRQISSKLGKK